MTEREPVPECLACGACCFTQLPEAIRVTGDDHARMGERAQSLTRFLGHRCYMALHDGHCAALAIDPARGAYVCSIYDERPSVCRSVERGSGGCAAERDAKGPRAIVALRLAR